MSRLADRMMTECQPARLSLVIGPTLLDEIILLQLAEEYDKALTKQEFQHLLQVERGRFRESEPIAVEEFDVSMIAGAPVFAADEIAIYTSSLPVGTNYSDVVASMAPPFDKFFIEFQGVPNLWDLHAWGVLVTATDDPESMLRNGEGDEKPRWELKLTTFLEREKGKPFGPVARSFVGLAEDGTWFRHADGGVWWAGEPVSFDKEPPDEIVQQYGDNVAQLLFPALLTISFMHCKNVEIRAITQPPKLSRKHRKRHGRDLIRYHVLEIEPIRRLLERHRTGERYGLRHALHICRGHFKTFTEDAPLLGRHVGTYWWAPQVRGSKHVGVVLKDYRVRAPSEFGRTYKEVDEHPPDSRREAPPSKDPDSVGRGLAAHNRTQNTIAEVIRKLGWVPRSPGPGEPDFDVAWKAGETLYVCEVKSLTAINEERQLRIAIGQVIRYRQKLAALGHEPVAAVIATELPPEDQTWNELCLQENIMLVWPEVAEERFRTSMEETANRKEPHA